MILTKKICLFYRYCVSNRNFITEHIKIVENSRFFVKNSRFKKNLKFQDFLRVLGKVATLMISLFFFFDIVAQTDKILILKPNLQK